MPPSARGTWGPSQLSRAACGCHSMTLPLQGMRLSQAWLEGQPDTTSRRDKGQAVGAAGSEMQTLGCGGGGRRARECSHTGETGVSPVQEGEQ